MITYKGLPGPIISDHLSRSASKSVYEAGTEFHIGRIDPVANTGTYLDSPFHRYSDGKDLSQLELDSLANLESVLVRCLAAGSDPGQRGISPEALAGCDLKGKAVLFHTGWDRYWRTEKYSDGTHPFLTAETAKFLVNACRLSWASILLTSTTPVRADVPSIPCYSLRRFRSSSTFATSTRFRDSDFRFFAVPVKVKCFGTFPVRAFALCL